MAGVSADRYTKGGFLPYRKVGGNYNNAGFNYYPIQNGMAKNLFKGDPVKLSAGTIDLATNTDTPVGIFDGVYYVDPNSGQPVQKTFFPSGTSMEGGAFVEGGYNQPLAKVYDDPHWTFKAKTRAGVSVSAGHLNGYAKVTAAGTGSTRYGQSDATLDVSYVSASVDPGGSLFRIISKVGEPGNAFDKQSTVLEVVWNRHLYK